jgi:WXG100 family type VII secretion target
MAGQDEIKLVYEVAEDMVKVFNQGGEQLQDTMQEIQSIANMLEEEALKGSGGEAYVNAIRGKLASSLTKLTAKFQEMSGDVQKAMEFMRQADETSKGKF